MQFKRKALKDSIAFEGLGLHSGVPVKVRVHPGEDGIEFQWGSERVRAHPSNVTDTSRWTRLGSIGMVEHIMSALAGREITDAVIEVTQPELPALDGSGLPYFLGLGESEIVEVGEREVSELFTRIFMHEDDRKIAIGKGHGHWRYTFDLGARWPGIQSFESADVVREYGSEIAPARTIVLREEIATATELGLGKGLDETSCLIVGTEGYENPSRFTNEPARHKLLDLIGDLYLTGIPVRMLSVVAERSGHRTNVRAAAMLAEALSL